MKSASSSWKEFLAWLATTESVLQYLTIRDAERMREVCVSWCVALSTHGARKQRVRACALGSGSPMSSSLSSNALRLAYWENVLCVDDAVESILNTNERGWPNSISHVAAYERLAGKRGGSACLAVEDVEGEILRDVTRTFPTHSLFASPEGRDALANILKTISTAIPEVGYCQGMNFVIGSLLACIAQDAPINVSVEAEASVFWIAAAMVRNLDMVELWKPGVPQLKYRIYQFDRLLASLVPELHAHFANIGLSPDFFASRWFLTLFSYSMGPCECLYRFWDVFFHEGWKTVFRAGIAMLKSVKERLLSMSLEEISKFFRAGKHVRSFVNSSRPGKLVERALAIKVSNRFLRSLEDAYVSNMLLKVADGKIRRKIDSIESPTKCDVRVLRARIEGVDHRLRESRKELDALTEHLSIIDTDLDDLREFKDSTCEQLHKMMYTGGIIAESEFAMIREKIEALEAEITESVAARNDALVAASSVRLDVEELVDLKRLFSDQLCSILALSEQIKATTLRSLFDGLDMAGAD